MRLFQPSGIIPSSFAGDGGGVVDASASAVVSWQLNGNARLWKYQIIILNAAGSTTVDTTTHTYDPEQSGNEPPYTSNENGSPAVVVANLGGTWASHGLVNGSEYRLRIVQYYKATDSDATLTELLPDSDVVFETKAAPVMSIDAFSTPVESVSQVFTASYAQAQGSAVRWVRWVLENETDGVTEKDTGETYTQVFSFSYDGFLDGKSYTVSCEACTQDGVRVSDSVTFSVSYTEVETYGALTVSPGADDSVALSWMAGRSIPGEATGGATVSAGLLHLPAGASASWDEVNGDPMSFPSPWSLAWRGMIGNKVTDAASIASGPYTLEKTYTEDVTETVTKSVPCTDEYNPSSNLTINKSGIATWDARDEMYHGTITADVPEGYYLAAVLEAYAHVTNAPAYQYEVMSVTVSGGTFTMEIRRKPDEWNGVNWESIKAYAKIRVYRRDGYYGILDFVPSGMGEGDLLVSITMKSTTADSATAAITGGGNPPVRFFRLEVHDTTAAESYYVVVEYTIRKAVTGSDSYRSIVSSDEWPGAMAAAVTAVTSGTTASVSVESGIVTVTFLNATGDAATAELAIYTVERADRPSLVSLNAGGFVLAETEEGDLEARSGLTVLASLPIPPAASEAAVTADGQYLSAAFFDVAGSVISTGKVSISGLPSTVTSISTTAPDDLDQTVDYIVISSGYAQSSPDTRPSYEESTLFYASFTSGLNAGTVASSGAFSTAIYRSDGTRLVKIGEFPNTVLSVTDWGIVSDTVYTYRMYYVLGGVASLVSVSDPICVRFRSVSLLEARDTSGGYKEVIRHWRFGNNLAAMPISNNYAPSFLANFTKYPLYQPASQAPKSGTLSALLSNFVRGVYQDTARQMEELFDMSESVNSFYLRDMKGNIYQVRPGGAITQTVNTENGARAVTVSVPWKEDGDAAGISLVSF